MNPGEVTNLSSFGSESLLSEPFLKDLEVILPQKLPQKILLWQSNSKSISDSSGFLNQKEAMKYQFYVNETGISAYKPITMNVSFYLRNYINKNGNSQVYILITSQGKRVREPMGIEVNPKFWDKTKGRLKKNTPEAEILNLLLDNTLSKITNIRRQFYLNEKTLTLDKLMDEYKNASINLDFVAFMKHHVEQQNIKPGSLRKERSRIRKFEKFRSQLFFSEITLELIDEYRLYMARECKNNNNTIDSNLRTIKKYLNLAKRRGVRFNLSVDEIKTKNHKGNRNFLSTEEIKKLLSYYFSDFIREKHRLPLGYFLFCCFTGIRLNEVRKLRRETISETITFISDKTGKQQTNPVNKTAKRIVESYPNLFVKWISNEKMNDYIRECCKFVGITKHVSFHVSRHSFATNFLRKGGKVEDLKKLLNHSKLETTMVYVHMLSREKINVSILDEDFL